MAGPVQTPTRTRARSLPSQLNFTVPDDPDDFKSSSDYFSAVSIALMGFQFIASQFYIPGIVAVFDAAIQLTNALRDAKRNSQEACRLVKVTSDYTNLVMKHAADLSSIPSASKRMEDLEAHLASFVRISSKIVKMAGHMNSHVFGRVLSVNADKEELQRLQQKLEHALNTFQTEILCHIDQNVYRVLDELQDLSNRIDNVNRNIQQIQQAVIGAAPFFDGGRNGDMAPSYQSLWMDDSTSSQPMSFYLIDKPPSYSKRSHRH